MSQGMNDTGPKCFGTATRTSFVDMGDKTIPGPAAYAPWRWDNNENPEWVIGTSEERDSYLEPYRQAYPSPQQYKVNHASVEKQPHKYSIPESKEQYQKFQANSPLYNPDIKASVHEDPHYSFGYHFENNYDNKKPGVGSYQLKNKSDSFNKTQNYFGSGSRPMPYGEQGKFPGATKYNTVDFNSTAKFSFPKTQRMVKPNGRDPPAKFYEISPKKSAPSNGTMHDSKGRTKQSGLFSGNQNPGPSHYNAYVSQKVANGIMYASKRGSLENNAISHFPSPQKYSGEELLDKSKRGQSFVKEVRNLSVQDKKAPGPGAYQFGNNFSHLGGAIGINGKKQKPEEPSKLPGANYYRPKLSLTKARAQSTVVFRGDRIDFSKTITGQIGPGQYNLKKDQPISEFGKIGRGRRQELYSSTINPGVGDYNIPNTIGKLPKYYRSPKKINENGFSTFHEKMKMKLLQRQRNKILEEEKAETEGREGQSEIEVSRTIQSPSADD